MYLAVEMAEAIDYRCDDCGDDGVVVWDAYATWDAEDQKYYLYSSYDHCECQNCGSTDITEFAVNEDV